MFGCRGDSRLLYRSRTVASFQLTVAIASFGLSLTFVSSDTYVDYFLPCAMRAPSASKRTRYMKVSSQNLRHPLLVSGAVLSLRSLVMLKGLLAIYQEPSWGEQHKVPPHSRCQGHTYMAKEDTNNHPRVRHDHEHHHLLSTSSRSLSLVVVVVDGDGGGCRDRHLYVDIVVFIVKRKRQ